MNQELAARIASNMARIREDRGMSQRRLAMLAGVSSAAVSNWEAGTAAISVENLVAVARALEVPATRVIGIDEGGTYAAGFEAGWAACWAAVATAAAPRGSRAR